MISARRLLQVWRILPLVAAGGLFGTAWWFAAHGDHQQTVKAAQEAAEAKRGNHKYWEALWQRTTEDPIALYTLALTVFTGLLAVVSSIQIRYVIRADQTAKDAAEAALKTATAIGLQNSQIERSVKEASRAADAMMLQANILETQRDINRQTFIATHRPRLAVRNVVLKSQARRWPGKEDLIIGELPEGQIYVVNKGGYEAEITDFLTMIYVEEKSCLPMGRPYEGRPGFGRVTVPLLAGQSMPLPVVSLERIGEDTAARILRGAGGGYLYIMGWIEYRDGSYDMKTDTQLTRRTAFCRKYDAATQRFVRVQDEDYEHEE